MKKISFFICFLIPVYFTTAIAQDTPAPTSTIDNSLPVGIIAAIIIVTVVSVILYLVKRKKNNSK